VQPLSLPPNLTGNIFTYPTRIFFSIPSVAIDSLGSYVSVCKTAFLTCLHQSSQVHVDVTICKLRTNSIASVFDTDRNDSSVLFLKWLCSLAFAKFYCFFVLFFNLSFSVLHVSTSLLHLDQSYLVVLLNDCQLYEYQLNRFGTKQNKI